jgi:AcrR family transcriptional regulator
VSALPVAATMAHTRQAILDGALRAVAAAQGTDGVTMTQIAREAGVAKATLYNHFRTKDDLVAGLVADDVAELGADCRDLAVDDLAVALTRAADGVAAHPVLVGLRSVEPAALLAAAAPGAGAGWDVVRAQVALVLDAADRSQGAEHVDLVCRWIASHVIEPGTRDSRAAQARALAAVVPAAVRTTTFAAPTA